MSETMFTCITELKLRNLYAYLFEIPQVNITVYI